MPERHRIVMEAISIAGMQECREGIDKVLALIATERASSVVIEPILSQLAKDVARIRKGELPLHKSEITQAQMMEGNERLGHAKDTVAVITEQNIAITKLDGEIKEQQAAVVTAENARQAAQAEQGARGLGSGLIAQYEEAKNAAIHEAMTKLGEMRISELIIIPVGTPTEKTINELFYIIQHQLDLSQMKLDEENPAAAKERKSATLAKTPGAETPDLDGRIERGKKLQDEIASLKEALARIKDCRTKIDEQEQKIKDAEKIVRQKEGDKNSADQKLKGLQDRRKAAIGEIWEWVDPDNTRTHPSYGSSLYATLLAEANLNIETVRRELEEQGIPILTEVTPAEVAKGPEVAEKPKTEGEGGKKDEKAEEDKKLEEKGKRAGVIVSKVDRQIADGMEAVINVGKVFGGKVAGLRDMTEDQLQREFADPATSQDNLIRYFFGPQALTPDKKPMYLRLLSKAGLVEAYFDYTGMDDSRAASFLARDPDFLAAYTESRRNNGEIAALRKRLNETHQRKEFGAPGLDDEVKSLEDQIHHLQARNVELLTPIYDKRIAPFLGEGGITTSAYSGMVIERMVRNASEYDPFADAVQSAEAFIPHPGPDGTMTILGPDINPRDNTSINLGHIRWEAPGDYAAVSGQAMKLRTATTIAADGSLDTVVQVKPIDMSGLIAILPDHRNDMVGSRVAEVLDAAGLLPHLYDAAGNKITPDQALGDWARARLPMTRPDMTNQGDVGTARVRDFIQKYGFNESIVDTIYRGTTVGAALNIVELRNVVRGIVSKQIESLEGLQIQGIGIANADALENWLTGGSRYFLGRGVEARRMFASLARAICANSPNVNQLLLGARLGQINIQEAGNTIFVLSNMNGQIMFSYIDSRLGHQVRPLSEIIKLDQAARTGMNVALTDARLNDILANLGKGSLEAIRRRTP
ncbi:hypothetical protein FJY90_05105 [Candidatus Gottesmanbacteria bacterium]|nr:hypothetical protein [Candidatus Gottesmanbacteria bacterium]